MFEQAQHTSGHIPNTARVQEKKKPFVLQRKGENNFQRNEAGKVVGSKGKITHPKSNAKPDKTALPKGLRSGLESLSGQDLSDVRVHHNSSKPSQIQAHAYTQGQDIYLGPGQEKYLPHEGWHAVQQMEGRVQPTIQQKSSLINDDAALEKEADTMGEKAVQMKADDGIAPTRKNRNKTRNGVIQRAMKFEYQFKKNHFYRDTGSEVFTLPRKYGPRDYIMRSYSGATMESETGGQIEFETRWEKKWSDLLSQVKAIQNMSNQMNNAPNVTGSDGNTYKKFPFSWALKHLSENKGFSEYNGRWARNQKDGKAKVKSSSPDKNYENMRSSTSYASEDNILRTLKNGTKVFVNYYSKDGKWARISINGKWGWMWSKSLTSMNNKQYEQNNKDGRGKYSDSPLQAGEEILVDVQDTTWSPYVQISESFSLEQYQSYLEQYDTEVGPEVIEKSNSFFHENNPNQGTSDEGYFAKLTRKWKFALEYSKLKNFLLMVNHYIKKGDTQTTKLPEYQPDGSIANTGPPGSAKYALNLLNRTHFGSIFKSMSKKEQELFTKMVTDEKNGLLPALGITKNSLFFMDGTSSGKNPKIYNWLVGITKGDDILSAQSGLGRPGAMGRLNIGEEKGKHEGLVRFEARNEPDNFPTLWNIDDHAKRHFDNAMTKRGRTDKTKLEP